VQRCEYLGKVVQIWLHPRGLFILKGHVIGAIKALWTSNKRLADGKGKISIRSEGAKHGGVVSVFP
jgi:hypothetical protein